ncbi:MAG: restriction endonuclease subunit S [Candidatus Accumulibacter phosphatis]|nr:restriction endonuclease subunit S [Candidatus Accumulibacter phosphatis]
MSNKAEKHGLVSKLRFPEFREAEKWHSCPLGEITKFSSGGTPSKDVAEYWGGSIPWISASSMYETNINKSELNVTALAIGNGTRIAPKGSLLILVRGSMLFNRVPMGIATIDVAFNQDVKALEIGDGISGTFLLHQLISFGSRVPINETGIGAGKIETDDLKRLIVFLPSIQEQQKIADCLASLDDLITLEAQKLDTLKTHKKGLMQKLFPAEGETLPKLRFPGFREAGKWEEKRLSEVGSVRMCKRIFKGQTNPRGDIPFYKIGTFGGVPDAYISQEIFESYRNNFPFPKNGAVLISAAGTIGRTVRYKGELAYFQDSNIVWLDNNEKLIADGFLFYLYQLINWAPSVGAIQRLYSDNILGAQVIFPSIPEQQEIADCLAYLDELITAQTQKLAALKTHKKGLMQQLFPVLGDE